MEDADKQGSWPRGRGGAREEQPSQKPKGPPVLTSAPRERGSVLGSGREAVCRPRDRMRVCLGVWTPRSPATPGLARPPSAAVTHGERGGSGGLGLAHRQTAHTKQSGW